MFGLRAVHMTASAWAYKPLHDPVVQMLKDHKIDTIEMDIKDEDGHVQYKSNVPLAQQDGAENTTTRGLSLAELSKTIDWVVRVVGFTGRVSISSRVKSRPWP